MFFILLRASVKCDQNKRMRPSYKISVVKGENRIMKREELKQIAELTDEQLDKIMAINGADVEKVKAKVTALEADLKEAKETMSPSLLRTYHLSKSCGDIREPGSP